MLSQEASAVVASFGQQPGVTREHLDNFNRVLNDSPELTRQIVAASRYPGRPVDNALRFNRTSKAWAPAAVGTASRAGG
ncbi:ABC-type transporter Mla subunit MlaD [Xanthomonas arboricola]|nr:ABC-type transporter Mla subunit MlaD [Xanthomonas arboricola]NIK51422.1 ABC-type transporter Mla subunit MlaD [Xanthomonas arboricola]